VDSINQGFRSKDETGGHGPKVAGARLPTDVSHCIGKIEIHGVSQVSGGQVFRQLLNGARSEITCIWAAQNPLFRGRRISSLGAGQNWGFWAPSTSRLAPAVPHLPARFRARFGLWCADLPRFRRNLVSGVTKRFPHLRGAHRRFVLIAYPLRVATQSPSARTL